MCARPRPDEAKAAIGRARRRLQGLAQGAGAPARRVRPPARRGAARRQGRSRPPRDARSRQDRLRRPRRGAGDDRHLRFRGRPVAPALRPDHRHRARRPPHDGDLASAGRLRRHLRLQLPRRRVVVERGARARLRRQRGVEAVREDPADGARHPGHRRARGQALRRRAGRPLRGADRRPRGRRDPGRGHRVCRSSPPPAPPPWAVRSARSSPSASPARSSSSAATTPPSSRPPPISIWRCAASPSPPWARRASAARRCAASSCTRASTTSSCRASPRSIRSVKIGDPRAEGTLVGPLIDKAAFDGMERALDEARAAGGKVHGGGRYTDVRR